MLTQEIKDAQIIGHLKGMLVQIKWMVQREEDHWDIEEFINDQLVELRRLQNQKVDSI